MAEDTLRPVGTPRELVRAAVAHAKRSAARELRFSLSGIEMGGHYGAVTPLTREGRPVAFSLDAVARHLQSNARVGDGWFRDGVDGIEFETLGTWTKAVAEDGTVRLKARKVGAPCLEALAAFDAEDLAALRALYRQGGVDVYVIAEGESRARDVGLAFHAERRAVSLPTRLDLPVRMERWPYEEVGDHKGPEAFDQPASRDPAWEVVVLGETQAYPRVIPGIDRLRDGLLEGKPHEGGRVHVSDDNRRSWGLYERFVEEAGKRSRAIAVMHVGLVKSQPVARIALNPAARTLAATPLQVADAPWETFLARREARAAARPDKPRTWLPTTEHVAESFVARVAPRGFVSGESLFFHGPVAFSVWRDNPIAAFARKADGGEVLVMGREPSIGGGKAAIVSMAQADIRKALGDKVQVIEMDGLSEFLRVGEVGVGLVAGSGRRSKAGPELPRSCTVDAKGLGTWFEARHKQALEQRDHAYRTKVSYQTWTQVQAEGALVRLSELRDRLADLFAVTLPPVGDLGAYRTRHAEACARYEARQAELAARRAPAADAPEPAGPRM